MGSGATSGSPAAREARIAQSVSARVGAVRLARPSPWGCLPFQKPASGLLRASRSYPWLRRSRPCLTRSRCPTQPPPLSLHPLCRWAIGDEAVPPRGAFLIATEVERWSRRCRSQRGLDAETEELGDGHSGHGAAGGRLRHQLVARKRLR